MDRKHFISSIVSASAFLGLPLGANANIQEINSLLAEERGNGSMIGFNIPPIEKVRVGIIGLGNRGMVLLKMFEWLIQNNKAEIVAVCDLKEEKTQNAANFVSKHQSKKAKQYTGKENTWETVATRDDIDLLLIATPWKCHTPMAIYGMENNKHVAVEVPISYTIEDCWKIIETTERTKKHCFMLENCNYNDEELFVLNMVEQGVFGELTHAECAYIHDLRKLLLDEHYYEDQWRLKHHQDRNGNFYTTHGIGPVSFYYKIGRGDMFTHLTSMSSKEVALSEAAQRQGKDMNITCGDMNTTLLKTAKGRTVMMQFDVHTGRPYDRINKLCGTKAVHNGYPSRLYIDKEDLSHWGHQWLNQKEYQAYRNKYTHPMITQLRSKMELFKEGHGGMDFVMIYRLISCLNKGLPLDMNVYDGVIWSAITPLSEISVGSNSNAIKIPDFMGGLWKEEQDLEIMRSI